MSVPAVDQLRQSANRTTWPGRPEFLHDDLMRSTATIAADLLDAIDALHQPITEQNTTTYCTECAFVWPCRTVRLLHPESQP